MLIGYARVSTAEQNPTHQIDALRRAGVEAEDIHIDVASGAKSSRPKLDLGDETAARRRHACGDPAGPAGSFGGAPGSARRRPPRPRDRPPKALQNKLAARLPCHALV